MTLFNTSILSLLATNQTGLLSLFGGGTLVLVFLVLFMHHGLAAAGAEWKSANEQRVLTAFVLPLSLLFIVIIVARFARLVFQ